MWKFISLSLDFSCAPNTFANCSWREFLAAMAGAAETFVNEESSFFATWLQLKDGMNLTRGPRERFRPLAGTLGRALQHEITLFQHMFSQSMGSKMEAGQRARKRKYNRKLPKTDLEVKSWRSKVSLSLRTSFKIARSKLY